MTGSHDQSKDSVMNIVNGVRPTAVSLFSSAGIGELGLEAAGLEVLLANELIPYRAALYSENFPDTQMVVGDIWEVKDELVGEAKRLLEGRELFVLYATPPCQGMSSNGAGKLKFEIGEGRRDHEEPRNRLIIPTVDLVKALRPKFLLLENVPQMANTVIRNESDEPELILDYIDRQLGPDYVGVVEVMACQDFGIPQRRKRLVTIYTRDPAAKAYLSGNDNSFVAESMKVPCPTLLEAIGSFPELDAVPGSNTRLDFHPQHRVPIIDPRKYWWIENTAEGANAFNNQCVQPECRFDQTPGHRDVLVDGKWTAAKDTPIHCDRCGSLLPRPTVEEKDGRLRAIRGFHSAYRRMRSDQPARTITQNFIYEASDNKIHPSQNRVLSVYEAMVVQSIDRYDFAFEIDGQDIGIPKIAEVIGESVAPYLIELLGRQLLLISGGELQSSAADGHAA